MPYITCKDGKTYSRYDTSPYVKQCIKDKDQYYREIAAACNKNPECLARKKSTELILYGFIIASVFVIGYLLYQLNKEFQEV